MGKFTGLEAGRPEMAENRTGGLATWNGRDAACAAVNA